MNHNNKMNTVAKNSAIMSIAVFFSRILGLIRDQVMAGFFGTSYINDAFNIAFNIPNLLRRLFGEGALSAAFVPIYNEFSIKRGTKFQILFAINVLSVLSFILLVLSFLGIVFAPFIVKTIYPGLSAETTVLAIKLCRLMFPYLFFIGLSSTFIAILNSHSLFFITGLSSGLLNIAWISTIIFGSIVLKKQNHDLIFFASYGVMLGGFLQTIINLPYLKKFGYKLKIILRFKTTAMQTLWNRFLPAMLGLGIREINLIADALIASFLPVGSISALGFGNRLMQLPLGIFGISVGTAVLPEYSKQFTQNNWDKISETLRFSCHFIAYLLIPISIIMITGSETFVRLIFQRGFFNENAVRMTSLALIFYVSGLTFFGLNQVITPLFYASKDTKTPVKISAFMVALNIALNLILMQYMAHSGLALATSLTALAQFCIMIIMIRKKLPMIKVHNFKKNILKIIFISCSLILSLKVSIVILDSLFKPQASWIVNLIKTLIFLSISFILSICLFQIVKPDYYKETSNKLFNRFKNVIRKS